jgi:hypothetical protein
VNLAAKLHILADAAKYDASCASSESRRARIPGGLGNAAPGGTCHSFTPDGRCVSLKTGLIYADATLGNLVLSEAAHREHVLRAAIGRIFDSPGVNGLRISVSPGTDEFNAVQKVIETVSLDVSWARIENHAVLPLPKTYDDFLSCLGYRTRRNFRYYRRRFETAGHSYVENMSVSDFDCAAQDLMQKTVTGADIEGVKRGLNIMSAVCSPLLVGLRAENGEWLAILGGWFDRGQGMVFMQMNDDRDNAPASLSLVLRGYLIETLIEKQVRELVFWAGAGGPMCRYTYPIPSAVAYLDKPTFAWRRLRTMVARTRGLLPRDKSWMAEWILPSCPQELENLWST